MFEMISWKEAIVWIGLLALAGGWTFYDYYKGKNPKNK